MGQDQDLMTSGRQAKANAALVAAKFARSEFDGQQAKIILDGDERFDRLPEVPDSMVQGKVLIKRLGFTGTDEVRHISNELFDMLTPALTFEAYPEIVPELIVYGQNGRVKAIQTVNSELRIERATRWQILEFCRQSRSCEEIATECDFTVKKAKNEYLIPMVEDGWLRVANPQAAESVQRFHSVNWLNYFKNEESRARRGDGVELP